MSETTNTSETITAEEIDRLARIKMSSPIDYDVAKRKVQRRTGIGLRAIDRAIQQRIKVIEQEYAEQIAREGKAPLLPVALELFLAKFPNVLWDGGTIWRWDDAKWLWRRDEHAGFIEGDIVDHLGIEADAKTINDLFRTFRGKRSVSARKFVERDPHLIPVANRDLIVETVDGDTRFRSESPNHPERFVTNRLAAAYDPDADCPKFREYLARLWRGQSDAAECALLVGEIMGATLSPEYPIPVPFIGFIHGEPKSGKSTLLKLIAWGLLGEENIARLTPEDLASRYRPAMLPGKFANIVEELPEDTVLPDATLKMLTEGIPITTERKFEHPMKDVPITAKHLWGTNHIPVSRDVTGGMFRRIVIIPYPKAIPTAEQTLGLAGEIAKDPRERSGILNFALDGLVRLLRQKEFTMPASSEAARTKWRIRMCDVARFIEDWCVVSDENGVSWSTRDCYRRYVKYCAETGIRHPRGERSFRERLLMIHGITENSHHGSFRTYKGVRPLREDGNGRITDDYVTADEGGQDRKKVATPLKFKGSTR